MVPAGAHVRFKPATPPPPRGIKLHRCQDAGRRLPSSNVNATCTVEREAGFMKACDIAESLHMDITSLRQCLWPWGTIMPVPSSHTPTAPNPQWTGYHHSALS